MTRRTREADGELASGIAIAEQDVGHGAASLLTEIPTLEDCGNILAEVIDRERPAIEQKDDERLAESDHGFDEFFLPSDQVEAGAVAHVVQSPGFARGLFVAANGEDDGVR